MTVAKGVIIRATVTSELLLPWLVPFWSTPTLTKSCTLLRKAWFVYHFFQIQTFQLTPVFCSPSSKTSVGSSLCLVSPCPKVRAIVCLVAVDPWDVVVDRSFGQRISPVWSAVVRFSSWQGVLSLTSKFPTWLHKAYQTMSSTRASLGHFIFWIFSYVYLSYPVDIRNMKVCSAPHLCLFMDSQSRTGHVQLDKKTVFSVFLASPAHFHVFFPLHKVSAEWQGVC